MTNSWGLSEEERAYRADTDLLSNQIIGAAIEVHRHLGPGLMESTYHKCMRRELGLRSVSYRTEVTIPIVYKGEPIEDGYRIDLLVENAVIVELKCVASILPVHEAQLLTYLRLTGLWLGLLINFNTPILAKGILRLVNGRVGQPQVSSDCVASPLP